MAATIAVMMSTAMMAAFHGENAGVDAKLCWMSTAAAASSPAIRTRTRPPRTISGVIWPRTALVDRRVNPLVRCLAEQTDGGQGGELAEKNHGAVTRAIAEARGVRYMLGRGRGVEAKLVLWTLDVTSPTDNESLGQLEQRLVEQLAEQGHHVSRCAESEDCDLLAPIRSDSSVYLLAFKGIGVSPR